MNVDTQNFDVIVIGTGPGGEGATMAASKCRRGVAAVERYFEVGGGCTHWGTIPSKALRQAIYHVNVCGQSPIYKQMGVAPHFSLPELVASANSVIAQQVSLRQGFYDRNDVTLVPGEAHFVDPHTIEVLHPEHAPKHFRAEGFVIATGSRPIARTTSTSRIRGSSTATRCYVWIARQRASRSMALVWWDASTPR